MNKVFGKIKTLQKGEVVKSVLTALAISFALFSIVFFAVQMEWDDMALSCAGIAYALIPFAVERWFRFRIQPVLYVFVILYAVCPLLGSSYRLYLTFSWWDDMLHGFAGVIFAVLGAYLPRALNKESKCSIALGALMGFMFSVAIAGLWECVEFGIDSIFGTDMQKDTIIANMRPSYLLGQLIKGVDGVLDSTGTIDKTVIYYPDGTTNVIAGGYLDVGLLDSMHDLLIETLGALIYTVLYIVFKGKKFVFIPVEKNQPSLIDSTQNQEVLQEVAATQNDDPTNN